MDEDLLGVFVVLVIAISVIGAVGVAIKYALLGAWFLLSHFWWVGLLILLAYIAIKAVGEHLAYQRAERAIEDRRTQLKDEIDRDYIRTREAMRRIADDQ